MTVLEILGLMAAVMAAAVTCTVMGGRFFRRARRPEARGILICGLGCGWLGTLAVLVALAACVARVDMEFGKVSAASYANTDILPWAEEAMLVSGFLSGVFGLATILCAVAWVLRRWECRRRGVGKDSRRRSREKQGRSLRTRA